MGVANGASAVDKAALWTDKVAAKAEQTAAEELKRPGWCRTETWSDVQVPPAPR